MESYKKVFSSFTDINVLIIGDVMLDVYNWGKVTRISPEAPIPVLACDSKESRLGGAANVAKNVIALGARSTVCSLIGLDENGDCLLDLFQKNNIPSKGILRIKDRITTVKTRFLSGSHHMLRVDEENTQYLCKEHEIILLRRIEKLLSEDTYNAIIFQDYDKGVLSPASIKEIKNIAMSKNIPTVVDPKYRNFAEYSGSTLFKPNFKEFVIGTGYNVDKHDINKLSKYAQEYRKQHKIQILLITLSSLGVLVCTNEDVTHIPSKAHKIADVSGAGDTVTATATLCLIAGLNYVDIARISNIAGSLVCKHPVIVSVDKSELVNEVEKDFDFFTR